MRLPLFCVVVMAFDALLASGGVGRQHHQGNGDHVRPQKRAQTDIADTTQGTRGVDADLRRGCAEADEGTASGHRETPLPT